jgi:hypothetical protein
MKSKTVSRLLFSILSLWGSSAIAADFTFTVPYDFKDLVAPMTIRCLVSGSPLDSLTMGGRPETNTYLTGFTKGHTDVTIQIDSFGYAKGTVQVPVDATIPPHQIISYMCHLYVGQTNYHFPLPPDYGLPLIGTYIDQYLPYKYKLGTPIRMYHAGAITQ